MPRSGVSVAQHNKAIRQEALRQQLAEQCRVQHILENIKKLEDFDIELDANEYNRIKAATELRLKVLNKYLPDLKQVEVGGSIDHNHNDTTAISVNDWQLLRDARQAANG